MRAPRRFFPTLASLSLGVGLIAALALPGSVGATPTPALYPQCPAIGYDTGCHSLITVSASGAASVGTDTNQPAIDKQEDTLVGIVNNSNASVASVSLAGTGIFGFDADGLCKVKPTPCSSPTAYGPTGYEGPNTSFTVPAGTFNSGAVNFTSPLAPGATAYFSLEEPGLSVSSVSLLPDIALTVAPVTGQEGGPATSTVASFTDGPSTAPPSDFTALVSFGDNSSAFATITQSAPGQPYVVTAPHIYAEEGLDTTGVTVTDTQLALNTTTGAGTANISDAPITVSSATISPLTTNVSFNGVVAGLVDANPSAPVSDFTATIDWGDGSSPSNGSVAQTAGVGSPFTVSGSHTYATHGPYTVAVDVTDVGGATNSTTDSVTVADAVATCSGTGCSGTATTTSQSSSISSTSTTGQILTNIDPAAGQFTCGDKFRHAPQITTITDTNLGATIALTVTFKNSAAAGAWFVPFAVCYQSQTPFKDLYGKQVTTGLLPVCSFFPKLHPVVAPCVKWIWDLPFYLGNVVENIIVPAGDPRAH